MPIFSQIPKDHVEVVLSNQARTINNITKMVSLQSVLRCSSGTRLLPMEDMVHLIQRTLLHADADMFPNIRLLRSINCMFPVSSSEAERSFPVLRTHLCNRMALTLMSLNANLDIDLKKIVARKFSVSSSEAERSFSVLRRIKTHLRNRMGEDCINVNESQRHRPKEMVARFIKQKSVQIFVITTTNCCGVERMIVDL